MLSTIAYTRFIAAHGASRPMFRIVRCATLPLKPRRRAGCWLEPVLAALAAGNRRSTARLQCYRGGSAHWKLAASSVLPAPV